MSIRHAFELTVPVNAIDHRIGPDSAPVTLVEYGDFECPSCKQAAPVVKLLQERFVGRMRFVFRHFPLEEVHPHALAAAEAAEAAGAQGKFWEMHDLLFEKQLHMKAPQLRNHAEQLQLDMVRFDADIGDQLYLQRVREHIAGCLESGARATPTFFLNGRIQSVSFGLQSLNDAIEAALG